MQQQGMDGGCACLRRVSIVFAGRSLTERELKDGLTAVKGELITAVKGEVVTAVKGELGRMEAMLTDRLSATRHASRIKRADLDAALEALKLRVIPAEDSDDLSVLMGQEPDQDSPGFW